MRIFGIVGWGTRPDKFILSYAFGKCMAFRHSRLTLEATTSSAKVMNFISLVYSESGLK